MGLCMNNKRSARATASSFAAMAATVIATVGAQPVAAQSVSGQTTPPAAQVQTPQSQAATLIADRVSLSGGRTLTAEGNVEIYFKGNRLTATRIIYDGSNDQLRIVGPIRSEDASGSAMILADSAEMSRDLQNGILQGARLVLSRELQLAATSIERKDGRYTVLNRVVASSCQVCATNPTPIWEIRANSVTHDAVTHQLHFESAQFRAFGVPIAWAPHLRVPDPTVKRMSGVLAPTVISSSTLGVGLALPYFITLGDSRDLTLTPTITTRDSYTMGVRYREAYPAGTMVWEGAITSDKELPGETRGYLFADGEFKLPRGYTMGVQLRVTSDEAYASDYDVTDDDRLWSGITVERVQTDRMIWGRVGNTYSTRETESNSTGPMLAGNVYATRTYQMGGGIAHFDWSVGAYRRASDENGRLGRDVVRYGIEGGFSRNWLLPAGILANATTILNADIYQINNDSTYNPVISRISPAAALTLRMPFVRQTGSAADVIEPVAQIAWSGGTKTAVPNEDSTLVEYDEGNLFAMTRYPGQDAREQGLRAILGLSATRHDAAGWSLGMTAGRIFKARSTTQYGASTGLDSAQSDWLIASNWSTNKGLTISNRALIDDNFNVAREDLRIAYSRGEASVSAGYLWIDADPLESRDVSISEILLDTEFPLRGNWSGSLDTRYDLTEDRAAKAALGLQYTNECVTVDLSLSRSYTSSSSVTPETSAGLSLTLAGFGASEQRGEARCTR